VNTSRSGPHAGIAATPAGERQSHLDAPAFQFLERPACDLVGKEGEGLSFDAVVGFERRAVPFEGQAFAGDDLGKLFILVCAERAAQHDRC
jgi:hypothetical protein